MELMKLMKLVGLLISKAGLVIKKVLTNDKYRRRQEEYER